MPQVSRARIPLVFLLGFTILIGCRDSSRTGPPEAGSNPVTVSYVCGNDFDIHNESGPAVTVGYAVLGTAERGELLLPAGFSGGSTTRLTTLHPGTLQVSSGDDQAAPVENGGRPCAAPAWSHPTEAMKGQWSSPFPWPVVAVHLHLLPSGRVLSWGRIGEPQLWDPASGTFTPVPSSTMVFCSGHTFLADGRLLVAGGHLADLRGLRDVNIFDGSVSSWEPKPKMRWARWYPTSTALADGAVLTIGGTDEAGAQVDTPEVWDGESWRALGGAARVLPYYPRTFVAPNGMVFYAGELPETGYLDPSGAGSWTPVATSLYGRRDYGTAVMYSPGKVLIVGGSDPPDGAPTNTAEVIDLNEASPSWRYTGAMAYPRRQLNATVLPDGAVLVTGGTGAPGFSDPAGSVHAAEAWNPGTGQWSLLASGQVDRVYHSTTILLADGRVLHAGSGDGPGLPRRLTAELFSPPYLFRGDRPVITGSPETIGYGQAFAVPTPDGAQVVRVTLVRLGSVTHAFDQSQRFIELTFERTANGLRVTAPASGALAPPGPYLLTLLNEAGVPSVGRVVRVG
jgi:galactose oxidase-like protein